jgi:hypothetical protein
VNVYVSLAALLTVAGFHVPAIPFVAVVGKVGTGEPAQIDALAPKANVGGTIGFTVNVNDTGTAHTPAVGVNV